MSTTHEQRFQSTEMDAESLGRTSAVLGITSMGLAMVGPCSCYVTFLVAIPIGLLAIHFARQTSWMLPDGGAKAYLNVGMATGIIATAWSSFVLLLIAAYILFYVVMVIGMVGLGSL